MGSPASFFAPESGLARAHPGYEYRAGQEQMARAVERTFEDGGVLMVEAGTGTGKTLAYLVPAVSSGRRVIVSTGTRNLQDQIFRKDLPFLRNEAGLEFSATLMKGRDNYLCRYRMAQFEKEPLLQDIGESRWVSRIAEWGRETETGDRAEISDLPDALKLWRDVNARADTCGGSKCPEFEECWLTRLKRQAQQSQVVVVNHHLFFADLALRTAYGAVLPDYDTVVFDEAHQLEEIATLYFGVQASTGAIEELARSVEKLAAKAGGPARGGAGAATLRGAAEEFFLPLRDRLRYEKGRQRFRPADRGGLDLEGEWAVLEHAFDELLRQTAALKGAEEVADSIPQRVDQLRDSLATVLDRSDPAFVYGMELRGRANVMLTAQPIDVGDALKNGLFEPLRSVVLTSATLAVDGRFDLYRSRLGLDDPETLIVESSFDHESQAVLYLPKGMPEPRDPMFVDRCVEEIEALLEITSGRAFLLFTSYSVMGQVREHLEQAGRWPLLVQGDGSKVALVEEFQSSPGTVLLGTSSFWHGVDVPGAALSLVVIDKLPFAVPSDPLVAARIERMRSRKENPFMDYQTPKAVLDLKQGLGRLIRSRSDRGIVVVLDPRLTTKRYGETFLRSLPPYRVVREIDAVNAFFAAAPDDLG